MHPLSLSLCSGLMVVWNVYQHSVADMSLQTDQPSDHDKMTSTAKLLADKELKEVLRFRKNSVQ